MRRMIRPAFFTAVSVAAIAGFVAAGRFNPTRLRVNDAGGWLNRSDPVDVLVEIARWVGLGLASYVAVVSLTALLAELAAAVRMPRVHRWLYRLVTVVALPALRRRLLELTTVATITAASMNALPVGAGPAPVPIALIAEAGRAARPVAVRGEYEGFGTVASAPTDTDPGGAHTVRDGDTLTRIIRANYGRFDEQILHDVLAVNPQITNPNLILVGWNIALPDDRSAVAPLPVRPAVDGEATWTVVTVQRGDTLWGIVDRHYGHATADLVWATVDANPDLTDPNLIFAGQLITLPPSPNDRPTAAPTTPTSPTPTTPATETPIPTAAPAPEEPVATIAPPMPVVQAPVGAPEETDNASHPATGEAPSISPPADTVAVATTAPPATLATASRVFTDTSAATDETVRPSLAELIGWAGGASLAVAILAVATRRRRRLPLAQRVRRPSRHAVDLGVALRETPNLATVDWAAGALRTVAARLRPRPGEPTSVPRMLRLADDQIELVWDIPFPEPSEPWQTPDGGWSWTLRRQAEPDVSDNPNPCPCLITIGRRAGVDVLLNLESCGSLAITGDTATVDALQQSIATELACSAFADAPTVLIVGSTRLPGEPEHARICQTTEAIGWLRDRSDAASALLAHRRLTSLFALRARSRPQDSHEPVVVLINPAAVPADEVATLIGLANGDLGAVVVIAGAHPAIAWQLNCSADTVTIEPLGLVLQAAVLNPNLAATIDEIVTPPDPETDDTDDDCGGADDQTPQLEHVLADYLTRAPMTAADIAPTDPQLWTSDDDLWDVELKILGQVRSAGTKQPLTPTELHLAIYLAFHRNGENSDTISTMVWPNGAADRTITNTMASLRRKLGTGPNGEMLFPLGRDNQYIYRLSNRVVTDWDRFITLTKDAIDMPPDEAIILLDQALELVDGPPFRAATGYSWAYSDGTATLITETVRAVAKRSIDIHLSRAEPLRARQAAHIAARATDTGDDDDLLVQPIDQDPLPAQTRAAD
jgi:phage tail protein X